MIITDKRSLLSLCTRFRYFRCFTNKTPPIVSNDVKHVSPILHFLGIFYFAVSINVPKFCQYFIVLMLLIEIITYVSTDCANAIIHFYFKNWWLFSPEYLPIYGRGNIWYLFLIYFHKTGDIVKHFKHVPTLIHQPTWRIVPSNQACKYSVWFCFVRPLIKYSLQITIKLRYIRIKENIHAIISGCFKVEWALNFTFTVVVIDLFICLILVVRSWTVSYTYAPL